MTMTRAGPGARVARAKVTNNTKAVAKAEAKAVAKERAEKTAKGDSEK